MKRIKNIKYENLLFLLIDREKSKQALHLLI